MARRITDSEGRSYSEADPKFDRVRVDNLERRVGELLTAVGDLQHRVSRLDGEDLHWPGDATEPTYTHPYEGEDAG
jgi:hypothetical protein